MGHRTIGGHMQLLGHRPTFVCSLAIAEPVMVNFCLCRALRDVIPPTPPGPEGSNGNGLVWAQ